MSFDLIIFDCDGTLVDTELLYNTVISDILIEEGLSEYSPQKCLECFTGLTLSNIRQVVEGEHKRDFSAALTSELYVARAQAEMDKGILPIEGAKDLLEASSAISPICVGSNGERSSVIKSLKLTDLYDHFGGHDEHIFTKIQVKNAKPAPDLFLYAAEKMNVSPEKCLVLEDSAAGVRAGRAAGMHVYGYTGSHHDPQNHAITLSENGADQTFSSLIHIVDALKNQKVFLNAKKA